MKLGISAGQDPTVYPVGSVDLSRGGTLVPSFDTESELHALGWVMFVLGGFGAVCAASVITADSHGRPDPGAITGAIVLGTAVSITGLVLAARPPNPTVSLYQ